VARVQVTARWTLLRTHIKAKRDPIQRPKRPNTEAKETFPLLLRTSRSLWSTSPTPLHSDELEDSLNRASPGHTFSKKRGNAHELAKIQKLIPKFRKQQLVCQVSFECKVSKRDLKSRRFCFRKSSARLEVFCTVNKWYRFFKFLSTRTFATSQVFLQGDSITGRGDRRDRREEAYDWRAAWRVSAHQVYVYMIRYDLLLSYCGHGQKQIRAAPQKHINCKREHTHSSTIGARRDACQRTKFRF